MWEAETWLSWVFMPGALLPDIEQSGKHDDLEKKLWIQSLVDYELKVFFKFNQSATKAVFFSSVIHQIQVVVSRWSGWWLQGLSIVFISMGKKILFCETLPLSCLLKNVFFILVPAALPHFSSTSLSIFSNTLRVWGAQIYMHLKFKNIKKVFEAFVFHDIFISLSSYVKCLWFMIMVFIRAFLYKMFKWITMNQFKEKILRDQQ